MRKYFTLVFILFFTLISAAQQREVGLLDLSSRNAEANQSRIRSCRHILQVAGVPFEETTSLTQALTHPVVMFSPIIYSTTFNAAERMQIQQFVTNGGVLIASSVRDPALYPLFGVSGFTTYTDLKRMTWHVDDAPQYFDRFDEGFEEVISLSDSTGPQAEPFNIRSYTATGAAQVLAHFENNTNAVITHQTGAGRTFLFSLDLRDVIIRNLINSDLHAQRGFSNIFEPTTDTFIFFIMNVIREHMPNTVRAHTCPDCDGSVVMITHDVDSRTAMDTMQIFINYEEQNNLNAMYNITTRYFHDSWMTDFYNGSYDKVHYVLQHGQRIASHSVGHFPDYDDETRFPFTSLGNTPVNYQPRHFNAITSGGNVYGEVEVSKYLLENDHNVAVKSFRAGHLAFNQRLPKALEDVGYLYNSTFSANDVLTNFPFWDIDNMTFSGNQTSLLEIPMTISDASASNPFTEQNALSIAQGWIDVTLKNHNNNAPTVLLIHPNRGYKLPAQEMFVNGMPDNVKFMFLDDFGDYWKKRIQIQISSELVNDTLLVTWSNYQINKGLSLVIDAVDQLSAVRFFDGSGNEMFPQSQVASYGETRYCQFVYDESFEVCNGIDDDGDGNIDENLAIAQYADTDQDGYGDPAVMINQCTLLPGYVTNNEDCNDQSTVVHPANSEYCDHLDNNCDGNIDEGFTWSTFYSDGDADGFGNVDVSVSACLAPDNFVLQPGDCDDENPNINPNVQEVCNDIDDNCDLNIDEGLLLATYYEDLDQDGYGNDAVSVVKCVLPFGFVALHGDCTDSAPAINPGAAELCGDGWDNDCDGQIDEGCIIDNDEDGFDVAQDCDDENALIFPGAAEVCNGFDDNCDGVIDEGLSVETYFIDNDADGFGSAEMTEVSCTMPLGYVAMDGDCDDSNGLIQPTAEEVCDEVDNNCNGDIDEGATVLYFVDLDNDGFGSPFNSVELCQQTDGFVLDNTDCDDNGFSINPGVQETCADALDNNCDGQVDEGCVIDNDGDGFDSTVDCDDADAMINPGTVEICNDIDDNCSGSIDENLIIETYFVDNDADGFGAMQSTISDCTQPAGYVLLDGDCDDNVFSINPGVQETCADVLDNNCDGQVDEGCVIDNDGDGFDSTVDCDDADATINPGTVEICNDIDDNCSGSIDENLIIETYFVDNDADGFGSAEMTEMGCAMPLGYVAMDGDCDDSNGLIQPTAEEVCDEVDNNCNGDIDEGATVLYFVDLDNDGFGSPFNSVELCQQTDGFVLDNTDCDDDWVSINPGVQETCADALDNNCDGQVDEGCVIDNDGDGFDSTVDCDDAIAMINPGTVEICNDIDDNCSGSIDENLIIETYFVDNDADGFGAMLSTISDCTQPAGYVLLDGDCDDNGFSINPGAQETCADALDNNCDGQVDEGCVIDNDGDGFDSTVDCDDANAMINPTAVETCNGLDDNCNGQTDENLSSASIASSLVNSAPFPTCTSSNIYSANFNIAVPANTLLDNEGVVIWYKLNAQYNALRVGLSAAFGDNELRLYESLNGCLSLIETEHEATTGNQVLLSDQLNLGNDYYIAVRHLSGPINSSAKICVNHFVASTCDHVYSNYTGVYSSVCSSFKAQYRGNAAQYVFNVLENQPWSYTTTSSNSIVTRLGSILPVNVGQQSRTYSLSVDVKYSVPDVLGNYSSLTALSTSTCNVTLQPEGNVALRATDRCPSTKALTQSIATDRSVCGTLRYEWKFTRTLPSSAPAIQVLGGMNTTVLFLNGVAGLTNNATYDVQVRAIHSSGVVGEWGSSQCMKIGAASGMILQPATFNDQIVTGSKAIWTLYPNPSLDGNVTIASNGQEEMLHHLQLFDAMGRSVWKDSQVFGGSASFNLLDVSHGMYTLSIDGERIRCVIGTE